MSGERSHSRPFSTGSTHLPPVASNHVLSLLFSPENYWCAFYMQTFPGFLAVSVRLAYNMLFYLYSHTEAKPNDSISYFPRRATVSRETSLLRATQHWGSDAHSGCLVPCSVQMPDYPTVFCLCCWFAICRMHSLKVKKINLV